MVEQERRNVDSLRQELAAASGASSSPCSSPSHDQRQQELEQAVRRLNKLEEQLDCLKTGKVCRSMFNRFLYYIVLLYGTLEFNKMKSKKFNCEWR